MPKTKQTAIVFVVYKKNKIKDKYIIGFHRRDVIEMDIKPSIIRFWYWIGLIVILFLNSCHPEQKIRTAIQIAHQDSIDNHVKTESVKGIEQIQLDTLTIWERQFEGEKFYSHIKLDFAKASINIIHTSQIRLIDKICAISVLPDTLWIDKLQREMGDDWDEVLFDIEYYEYLAIDTLEKLSIPTFYASREKRYINFIKADKSSYIIDLTKMKDAWGLILFNGTENPVFWNSTDIDTELKEIYKK